MLKDYLAAHQPDPDQIWSHAETWCNSHPKALTLKIGHWEMLVRETTGCATHAQFHQALVNHLTKPKGREESRWKKHEQLTHALLDAAGQAASTPQLPEDLVHWLEHLSPSHKTAVLDRWRLVGARAFLQAVLRILKTRSEVPQ